MKKLLSFFTIISMCIIFILPARAEETDPLAVAFKKALHELDYFYELNAEYMAMVACNEYCKYDETTGMFSTPTLSAAEFEGFINKHFYATADTMKAIGESGFVSYNAADNTYTLYGGGGMGGALPPRQYLGYVKKDSSYDVFYQHITYESLGDVLPEGTSEDAYASALDYPGSIEYNGVTYTSGCEGYTRIKSYDDFGKKYNVEYNDGIVRIMSCVKYEKKDLPDSFDDNKKADEPVYDIPENNVITIPENECFDSETTVKVEEVVKGEIFEVVEETMEVVAEKYVAYEFTATKNNTAVQPNGKLAVTFAIPDGFSTDIIVYYMETNGDLEELKTTVDAATRTATAELEHFSTYILADNKTKPVEPETTTEPETTIQEVTTKEEPTTSPETDTTTGTKEDETTSNTNTEEDTTSVNSESDDKDDNDKDEEDGIPVYVWIIILFVVASAGAFFGIKFKKK